MTIILSGKDYSTQLVTQYQEAVTALKAIDIVPKLVVITVGDDPASQVYVGQKQKRAATVGIDFEWEVLPTDTSQATLTETITRFNQDPEVSGIIVQLPLPAHLDETLAVEAISPEKDVDGFHPYNLGRLVENTAQLIPCTPKGIMDLLAHHQIELAGKRAVIIGRSQIVGLPLALLLTHANATVTVCHSYTQNTAELVRQADILVTAAGNPDAVDEADIQPNAVVVDVSMNRNAEGRLCGDVDYRALLDKVQAITPVPGGVGPMTVAMLMGQTIACACRQHQLNPADFLKDV